MKPLTQAGNIEILYNTEINDILGKDRVSGVQLKNSSTGAVSELACDGVFVAIGRIPNSELVTGQINTDQTGYVIADETTCTNIPGVFAGVGDLRTKPLRQVITAASDGAVASKFCGRIHRFSGKIKIPSEGSFQYAMMPFYKELIL